MTENNEKKVKCLQCGHEQVLTGWSLDSLGYLTTCNHCCGSFDIDDAVALSILVPPGTKVVLKNGTTGIIDGSDFEDTEEFANINYYFCEDQYTITKQDSPRL